MNPFPKTSILQKSLWLLLLPVIFSAGGCGASQLDSNSNARINSNASTANSNGASVANDDTAALAAQILLPFVPEEVVWREEPIKKSDDKKLTAVLKYTEEDAKNLVAQAEKHRPAETVEIGAESWFPQELVAQSQMAGDDSLKGAAYAANDFLQVPYKNGRLIKVENSNYFILELSTQ